MGIMNFLKNAFGDMKKSASAQHKVDKANLRAAKAESKAQWAKAKAMGNPNIFKMMQRTKRSGQIADAKTRIAAAEKRTAAAKKIGR